MTTEEVQSCSDWFCGATDEDTELENNIYTTVAEHCPLKAGKTKAGKTARGEADGA